MRTNRTLKSKLSILVFGVLTLVALLILSAVFWVNTKVEERRLHDMEAQVRANIDNKASVLVDSHVLALRALVADNAFTDVREMVEGAVKDDPEIVYGVFISNEGKPWAYAAPDVEDSRDGELEVPDTWRQLPLTKDSWSKSVPTRTLLHAFGGEVVQVTRPVVHDGEMLGMVAYGFSTDSLQQALLQVQVESKQTLRQMLNWIVLAVLASTLLGFLLVRRVAERISSPLQALTAATDRIAGGEKGVRVSVDSNDELEALAGAFNHMQASNEDAMQKLSDAMDAALEASRLKSEFLANMSHEIRTPMNGVIGMIRLILKMPLEGKIRRYAETVDASASALMTIINDVLDFSKMEAGKYELQSVSFEPGIVMQEVAELLSGRAYDKQLELVYRKAPDVPAFCVGDPDRYRQILNNLVGNAIKFTEEGEVFVELTLDQRDDDGLVLRTVVQDSGIGIGEDDITKLFDAFSQVDGSMVRQHGGTGLGLAISKRLAEMMGGEIGVTSERSVGSRFWFTVRVKQDMESRRAALASLPDGRRAIVVESSRRWCRIIREHLTTWGLKCDVYQDGRPGLRALEGSREPYDIAVVGAQLRDLAIEDFVAQMRQIPGAEKLPIIALTQLGTTATLTEVENELTAQIAKPLRLSELYDCIVGTFAGTGIPAPQPRAVRRAVRNRGKKILIVDDNDINQFVATEQVTEAGFEAEVANNGVEAVARVKAGNYAVVLMDCQMPVMDGYTATRAIREWEGNQRHVPIIALTAHAMAGERDKVLAAGMDDYLAKPLRAHSLERMLERYVNAETGARDQSNGSDTPRVSAHESLSPSQPRPNKNESLVELDMSIKRSPRLVELFVSRVPDNLQNLDDAIDIGNAKAVRASAHKLKGSCLAVGAERMAKEAESLQLEAEAGDLTQACDRAKTLWSQYDRVIAALEAETPANDAGQEQRLPAE